MPDPSNISLGYLLAAPRRTHEPGHPAVDIWINDEPTLEHFDPEQVRLAIANEGHVDVVEIEHPWSGDQSSQLAAGMIIITDRKNKHIDGFLFGGRMEVEVTKSCSHIKISSPAPIMVRESDSPEITLLIEESCILLARRYAVWAEKPEELEKKLSSIEPLKLYAAFLLSIQKNLKELPPSEDETLLKTLHIIHEELREVSTIMPGFELPLETLC